MKLAKDYNYVINYHLRKANIVADVLSRKSANLTTLLTIQKSLHIKIKI